MLIDHIEAMKTAKMTEFPKIRKMGTLAIGVVETTPVVWKGRLYRFEWVRNHAWAKGKSFSGRDVGRFRFVDMETEACTPEFADDHSFGCAHVQDGKMYVCGTRGPGGGNILDMFVSDDLIHWNESTALEFSADTELFNTSICSSPNGYVMAIEAGGSSAAVGTPFTCFFATSSDLINWTLLPTDRYVYARERYTACPVIRYYGGYFYMIYLERMPLHHYVPYIVRTKDLEHFELGIKNPVMFYDDGDKLIYKPEMFTDAERYEIASAVNCNNSDVDICEYNGKTVIMYSWGNQLGSEYLAWAEYDGKPEKFLRSFFE